MNSKIVEMYLKKLELKSSNVLRNIVEQKMIIKVKTMQEKYMNQMKNIQKYWSMPNSSFKKGTLPHLIGDLCLSCSEAQKLGDKVHFIIAQVYKDDYSAIHTQSQQGIVYNIIEGWNNRYEGYKHQNTQGTMTVDSVGLMEFVFKKSGIILENYKNVASKFRRFFIIDLLGDDEDRINEYKIMIQSSYNLLYFDIEGIRRYYIGDDDYQPQFNSDIVNMNHLSIVLRVYPLQTIVDNYKKTAL
ncbi:hypothetical protein ACTFIT_008867 [Dictyostelium discoideum]